MKRKLVKQGAATMMISLPSKWIKANKLGKGDEIDLQERGNNLLIGAETKGKKEISIILTEENSKDIKNLLTHAYRRGFDKITLKGFRGQLKEVTSIANELLLGFEITETGKELVIENISEPTEKKYDIIVNKAFKIIDESQKIIIEDFAAKKFSHLEDIGDLKKQQDRFLLFCRRLLVKENSEKSILSEWEVLNFLMHIEHRYYYLYEYAAKNKISTKEILDLLRGLEEYFNLYKNAYFNSEINSIHKINNLRKEYYFGKCIKYLEKSKGKETIILSYIREIYRIMQLGTSPILSQILEKS